MERLTAKRRTPRGAIPGKFSIDFIFHMPDDEVAGFFETMNRLADYEDTGMEPEEINGLREFCESATNTTLRHIAKLVQAEREGRLVVTPHADKAKRTPAGKITEETLQALERMGNQTHTEEGEA